MKTRIGIAVVVLAALMVATAVHATEESKKSGNVILVPAGEAKWSDVATSPGVKMAVVEGDATKGPFHFLVKFPGGFSAPLHHHTSNHYVTVVAGTLVLTVDGEEKKLPAGSFFAFTGKKKHETKCEAGADCVLAIDCRGKWDVVPEQARSSAKK